jgi:hypothetical protein
VLVLAVRSVLPGVVDAPCSLLRLDRIAAA